MTLSPLHLVVNWLVFAIYLIIFDSSKDHLRYKSQYHYKHANILLIALK